MQKIFHLGRNNLKLPDKIKFLRKKNNLTQAKLSDLLEIERRQIYRYEIGEAKPSVENLKKLADIFKVTTDFLLDDSDESLIHGENKFNDKELFMYFQEVDKMDVKTRNAIKLILRKVVLSKDV